MMNPVGLFGRRFHYGWVVAAVTFVTLLIAAGVRSTPGVIMVPLEQEFGWSRETISFAVSVNILLYGLIGPFAASFMTRFGVRRTMIFALSLLGVGVGLTTLMTTTWQLTLLWGVVVGIGCGASARVLGAVVAARWFVRQRGLVVGLLTASTATGQLLFLPFIARLAEMSGWRYSTLTVAAAALVLIPLVTLLMRDRPRDVGLLPYGAARELPERAVAQGNMFIEPMKALIVGFRSRDFWLLCLSFAVCGASTNGLIGTHLIAACFDHGIPEVSAAGLLVLMGFCDLIGTTVSGWLSDRWDSRYLLSWYYGLRGLSLLFLPYALDWNFYALWLFAVFYGLDWIATVPPTVRLATNAFGDDKVGVMYGWIGASHQIGASLAAYGAGLTRTALGDYQDSFWFSGILCLIAAVLVLGIGRRWKGRLSPVPVHP
jgi:sugar phosphate permease